MTQKTPIAVVGMAGIFPGAPDVETFWQNLIHKQSAVVGVPEHRWIIPPKAVLGSRPQPDRAISGRACLIRNFDFDPNGFDLPADLLRELDPLYQMVLQTGQRAFSGFVSDPVARNRIQVCLAAIALPTDAASALTRKILGTAFENRLFGRNAPLPALTRSECISSRVTGLPGAILARALGLGGGSFTLDAACASSIYAVKLACDELRAGRADAVLAGGVSRPECLYTQVGFSQLRALSPTGRCAPFDATADGLVVGEGAGILVLKRLTDALSHGDRIYGIIRGIGLSNDMRGNLLAPDSEGQVRAMQNAYAEAGWSPGDVDMIECHGAGTPVGDAVELNSLRTLWKDIEAPEGRCAIGSAKSAVGHLLTGAGAAGMIKTLLGMHHETLPPSLNYARPSKNSPLHDSPFRVQADPAPWPLRNETTPRRAAVSAFGFGGINAHLLFEAPPEQGSTVPIPESISLTPPEPEVAPPVAIVGMGAAFGPLTSLRSFQEAALNGRPAIRQRPVHRWKGANSEGGSHLENFGETGGYLADVSLLPGEFQIPPNEIPDILPQQLLMLKVGAAAMKNAGLPLREYRPRMGTTIGISFDMEATSFHLRWNLHNEVERWKKALAIGEKPAEEWLAELREACGPPLTPARTLGALGGIVASRIAREFRFGGPSYVVSGEETSGIRALEIGVRSLQQKETDAFLTGAVDLAGDVRNMAALSGIQLLVPSHAGTSGSGPEGHFPGEGAVALVLKRLDDAVSDGDRVYAVIKGMGNASGGGITSSLPDGDACVRSLQEALSEADAAPSAISYVETCNAGPYDEHHPEALALRTVFGDRDTPSRRTGIGSVQSVIGHTGAASGLASVAKAAICLYQEILPPSPAFPDGYTAALPGFHIPASPQFWLRDRADGPRRSCVSALTWDGSASHVILEQAEMPSVTAQAFSAPLMRERRRPLGFHGAGLFVVEGDTPSELLEGLDDLSCHIHRHPTAPIDATARTWFTGGHGTRTEKAQAVSVMGRDTQSLEQWISAAREAVQSGTPRKMIGPGGVCYFPEPLGPGGELAFVFPGSGNHYLGMGRILGIRWPEVFREMDAETLRLKTQMLPHIYMPWRRSWKPGWEEEARETLDSDPVYMIFGQVVHGGVVTNLVRRFGIEPSAVIGYSLGESAGYFATGAWPERGEMLKRMQATDLFSTRLAGPCLAARKAWNLPDDEPLDWRVAMINRAADRVQDILPDFPLARLLIINTPEECVIGGHRDHVEGVIRRLRCDAFYLEGVVTVHCETAEPVADAYRELHVFPTTPPEGIRYYSVAHGEARALTADSAADSILAQALHGFDFTETVEQAYQDGVRIFLEMGPGASCRRMIDRILGERPHSAISACARGEADDLTLLKALGTLIAERVPADLSPLYGEDAFPVELLSAADTDSSARKRTGVKPVKVLVGGKAPVPSLPSRQESPESEPLQQDHEPSVSPSGFQPETATDVPPGRRSRNRQTNHPPAPSPQIHAGTTEQQDHIFQAAARKDMPQEDYQASEFNDFSPDTDSQPQAYPPGNPDLVNPLDGLIAPMTDSIAATADAHREFLAFSDELTRNFGQTFAIQNRLIGMMLQQAKESGGDVLPSAPDPSLFSPGAASHHSAPVEPAENTGIFLPETQDMTLFAPDGNRGEPVDSAAEPEPAFSRELCIEFAVGSVARVLGPEFAAVDTYRARVRLPDEPLMLVDRILTVEGEKGSLGAGRVVTEHDVLPGAWYLDADRAPVCISVEAGQADLFLCSWLGIDLQVKGRRTYRLLDAKVRFHRSLPRPGDTIRYEIEIDRFVRQGETWMFFFRFEGYIGDEHLITMRDGCAGFFTEEEVKHSGGIILTEKERQPQPGIKDYSDLIPVGVEQYDDTAVEALRRGDAAACFGPMFDGITIPPHLRLPDGLMRLLHRVLHLDPDGGRFGLGIIRAEADIHPDDWFLTCHFVDDMVMPGTLMYECCAHTLRVLLQRMGWIIDNADAAYEPCLGSVSEAVLKCRGPVTPETKHVVYDVEIREIGYNPEPYVIADAMMYGDGHAIVRFTDMSMRLTGTDREELETFWQARRQKVSGEAAPPPVFDRNHILAFALGNPSQAFGEPYRPFDSDGDRRIARLPAPPYSFIDRITGIEPQPWVLKPGGWVEAEYDVPPDAWYFRADRTGVMPFAVLLEIALQPCGWLAAYAGSALKSSQDLKFRNLGGEATVHRNVYPDAGTLTMRTRLTQASEAGGMIIEYFDFEVLRGREPVYTGTTYFGFFTAQALAQQVGIPGAKQAAYAPSADEMDRGQRFTFRDEAPLHPDDPDAAPATSPAMPASALRMIDRIDLYVPDGGPEGLGLIQGSKTVDPAEWFFQAHFYQDPVCPGSLGLESFLQLLKYAARKRWGDRPENLRFELPVGESHRWSYRGQIIQRNRHVEVDAVVTSVEETPSPVLRADGYLRVDGLPIYRMENFGVRLVSSRTRNGQKTKY